MLGAALLFCGAAFPQAAPPQAASPEEPDFAFIAGGPYTQVRHSIQFIHAFNYGTRRVPMPGNVRNEDEFLFFQRTEWGFTDRWELDLITPAAGSRERLNGSTVSSDYGYSDTIVGVRYRLLTEEGAPFTLTMGPQVIFPTGSVRRGTGTGSAGFAWDVSAGRDWGGPVFVYVSANYSVVPSAEDPTPGSSRSFNLQNVTWATALGFRALERPKGGGNQDIHVFLEAGGSRGQQVQAGTTVGSRASELSWVFAPGVRYGFLTPRKTLIEIGVSAPIGLGPNGPKKGIIIQFQFERFIGEPPKD